MHQREDVTMKIRIAFIFRCYRRLIQLVVFVPVGLSLYLQHLWQVWLGVEVYTITRPWKPLHPTRTAEDVIATKGLQE